MIKVVHIITGLTTGGAEMMLYKLLTSMNRSRFDSAVISLMDKGVIGTKIEALGIPVYELRMKGGRPTLSALWRLRRIIHTLKPNLIQGWMYHGNIAALIGRMFAANDPAVLWNIRQTLYKMEDEKWLTQQVIRASRYLSARASRLIYNSRLSASQHEALGFSRYKRILLCNGFDVKRFCPSEDALKVVRQNLGLDEYIPIVGLFARYHPMKDHANFINAANIVYLQQPDVHFILVGRNVALNNPDLSALINASDAKDNIHLLGEREDIADLMAAIDIAVISSAWGEGFPNTLGEAMACGIPAVVTDVGDSAWILGKDNGEVVPVRDPQALAAGIFKLLNMDKERRCALGRRLRQRIVDEFSLEKITDQYAALYEQVYLEFDLKS